MKPMNIQSGCKLMIPLLEAFNLGDPRSYTRVVLVIDAALRTPMIYATKVADADSVLRVIETLKGAEVVAEKDSVETFKLSTEK